MYRQVSYLYALRNKRSIDATVRRYTGAPEFADKLNYFRGEGSTLEGNLTL